MIEAFVIGSSRLNSYSRAASLAPTPTVFAMATLPSVLVVSTSTGAPVIMSCVKPVETPLLSMAATVAAPSQPCSSEMSAHAAVEGGPSSESSTQVPRLWTLPSRLKAGLPRTTRHRRRLGRQT